MRYEMSEEQLQKIMDASEPVPMIALHCGPITSPQENANRAWQELGREMGFKWDTARPIRGEDHRIFTAEPL